MRPGAASESQPDLPEPAKAAPSRGQCLWFALEAPELIELERVALDRDVAAAADFFQRVIAPRVLDAAQQRGMQVAPETAGHSALDKPGYSAF